LPQWNGVKNARTLEAMHKSYKDKSDRIAKEKGLAKYFD